MVWTNSSTRHRLWRDTDCGILADVCAGIADYTGGEPIVIQLVAVLGTAPADTLHSLKCKFADLEARLGEMEGQVTSGDFDLHRRFRDLGR
jgi:hypothetical protein